MKNLEEHTRILNDLIAMNTDPTTLSKERDPAAYMGAQLALLNVSVVALAEVQKAIIELLERGS